MTDVDRNDLSDEQRAVVESLDQYIVVLASAGSGKTEVVAQRVERLLSESDSDFKIVALSYTRRAAAELRSRFAQRLADARRRVETDTIHGFAQRLLMQYGTWIGLPADPTVVIDDADRVDLLQAWRSDAALEPLGDARTHLLDLDLSRARGEDHWLAEDWSSALSDAGALDYEAMLSRATELLDLEGIGDLISRIYGHVIVDEAQNLTQSQYALLERLLRSSGDVHAMLVGDDKQSIVSFAGASADHILSFERDFGAAQFRLTCNFRSAEAIARLGDEIAQRLGDAPSSPQRYAARGEVTARVFPDEQTEAAGISAWVRHLLDDGLPPDSVSSGESRDLIDREIAILARSAASLRACEEALIDAGIGVARSTHADDWLMSDFGRQAWLLGAFRPESAVARRRLIRTVGLGTADSFDKVRAELQSTDRSVLAELVGIASPEAFIRLTSELQVEDQGWYQDQLELEAAWSNFADAQPVADRSWPQFELFISQWQRGDEKQDGIRVQTVHKSQGREFKAVALVGLNEGQFPDFRARTSGARKSELRAFYVAGTRASRLLLLSRPASTFSRNGPWKRAESSFLRIFSELQVTD